MYSLLLHSKLLKHFKLHNIVDTRQANFKRISFKSMLKQILLNTY